MPMARNAGMGIVRLQLAEQVEQRAFLRIGARIGRDTVLVEPALIADADALVVPAGGVGSDLVDRTADMHLTVAGDVEMIADIGKTPCQMAAAERLHRKMAVTARGAAMNYQEVYLPIVLIETACFHPANN